MARRGDEIVQILLAIFETAVAILKNAQKIRKGMDKLKKQT